MRTLSELFAAWGMALWCSAHDVGLIGTIGAVVIAALAANRIHTHTVLALKGGHDA